MFKLYDLTEAQQECTIQSPYDLIDREVSVHWNYHQRRYSVSLRASNGRWYVVRHHETGAQLFFGKLVMQNVHFKVAPAGAKIAYETRKRNVHATLTGTVKRAQFVPEDVVVPCGIDVMYSHILYPEPEFKLVGHELPGRGVDTNPGIEYAEMAALGVVAKPKRPRLLVTGRVDLIGRG